MKHLFWWRNKRNTCLDIPTESLNAEKHNSVFTRSIQTSELFTILAPKWTIYLKLLISHFFQTKISIFFLFLNKNICCGYSLEVAC